MIWQFLVCFVIRRLTRLGQDSQIPRIPGGRGGKISWKRLFKGFWVISRALKLFKGPGVQRAIVPFSKITQEFEMFGPTYFGALNK